jgi:hypothetical protein
MANDDLIKCSLCGGFTHIDKPELLAALNDPKIRQRIENYVTELLQFPSDELVATERSHGREFNREVHNWNPNIPAWRRSPKE